MFRFSLNRPKVDLCAGTEHVRMGHEYTRRIHTHIPTSWSGIGVKCRMYRVRAFEPVSANRAFATIRLDTSVHAPRVPNRADIANLVPGPGFRHVGTRLVRCCWYSIFD